jgi:hypothetical protein
MLHMALSAAAAGEAALRGAVGEDLVACRQTVNQDKFRIHFVIPRCHFVFATQMLCC